MIIAEHVNCDIFYLNKNDPTYTLLNSKNKEKDNGRGPYIEPLLDILDIMEMPAPTKQIIKHYRNSFRGSHSITSKGRFAKKKITESNFLPKSKLNFLYTGEPDKDAAQNFGLNYSKM